MSTLKDAIELCKIVEPLAEICGGHVALTGGCLYWDGNRKDIDILIYRIRQVESVDWDKFKDLLKSSGIEIGKDFGWCKKALWKEHYIDIFDPETSGIYEG